MSQDAMRTAMPAGRRRVLWMLGGLGLLPLLDACAFSGEDADAEDAPAAAASRPVAAPAAGMGPKPACRDWPEWRSFVARHVQDDGRVVDLATPDKRSTSEGQAYAMFFALLANDAVLFEKVLDWSRHNLSGGRPDQNLPAWLWGQNAAGQWGVLDANSASDADLWEAYALVEAGRLWHRPGYSHAGLQKLALVRARETAELPGLGRMVLPGAAGFVDGPHATLNPSYLPLPLLRRFAAVDPQGGWAGVATRAARMIHDSAPVGFVPDWTLWDGKAFVNDPAHGAMGSYDAIRVYLWAGMTAAADPLRAGLLAALSGPQQMLKSQGYLAEKVDTRNGAGSGRAPAGFAAALLPYLDALGEGALLASQRNALPSGSAAEALPYYERALVLFGKGWSEGRYRFSTDGQLLPAWRDACSATS
ncbi:cellulose synthase complex periplasmic endoglucanase BcsZ [Xanthomonas massiliensis]|uniref:cellulose synthase complex periplasmic endoglucanase BcsZ n=1 Tax=Xanthomonas massiliensis TaxID=1720302 RepID=UPI000A43AEA3|nr:cellulose synthase complex periplasmic endoglucanase BcsZ [Xanthomonas massiliensis]